MRSNARWLVSGEARAGVQRPTPQDAGRVLGVVGRWDGRELGGGAGSRVHGAGESVCCRPAAAALGGSEPRLQGVSALCRFHRGGECVSRCRAAYRVSCLFPWCLELGLFFFLSPFNVYALPPPPPPPSNSPTTPPPCLAQDHSLEFWTLFFAWVRVTSPGPSSWAIWSSHFPLPILMSPACWLAGVVSEKFWQHAF